jgi:hypothetical protein
VAEELTLFLLPKLGTRRKQSLGFPVQKQKPTLPQKQRQGWGNLGNLGESVQC